MGLFNRQKKQESTGTADRPVCLHVSLVPHWDSLAAMGHEAQADKYACDACGSVFTPAETKVLRATEAERLRQLEAARRS